MLFLISAALFCTPVGAQSVDHSAWDKLLQSYVSDDGVVDYQGLKSNQSTLNSYILMLKGQKTDNWNKKESMAFWINTYNAFTIKMILDNFPVSSIKDLENGNPWDKKWIEIGSEVYSLNNIEHDILRKKYPDARIHFVVNCAAKSCPPLPNMAATAVNLETLLEGATKKFVNNDAFNSLSADRVSISKIFDWYATDFSDIVGFINQYASISVSPEADIQYADYNWELNGK